MKSRSKPSSCALPNQDLLDLSWHLAPDMPATLIGGRGLDQHRSTYHVSYHVLHGSLDIWNDKFS